MPDGPNVNPFIPGPEPSPCKMRPAVAHLDDDTRRLLDEACAQTLKVVSHATIASRLADLYGVQLKWQSIRQHRNGACDCER